MQLEEEMLLSLYTFSQLAGYGGIFCANRQNDKLIRQVICMLFLNLLFQTAERSQSSGLNSYISKQLHPKF